METDQLLPSARCIFEALRQDPGPDDPLSLAMKYIDDQCRDAFARARAGRKAKRELRRLAAA